MMSVKNEALPWDEWIDRRIQVLIESKGRVKGQFDGMDKETNWNWGTYSWLTFLVGEVHQIYEILKEDRELLDRQNNCLRKLIGLTEESTSEQVEDRISELRDYFVEVERTWQSRKKKNSDVIQP